MNRRACLRPSAVAASVFCFLALASSACGSDVATCGDVCSSSSAEGCAASCSALQTACDTANDESDFQELLTCLANANATFEAPSALCESTYARVTSECQ